MRWREIKWRKQIYRIIEGKLKWGLSKPGWASPIWNPFGFVGGRLSFQGFPEGASICFHFRSEGKQQTKWLQRSSSMSTHPRSSRFHFILTPKGQQSLWESSSFVCSIVLIFAATTADPALPPVTNSPRSLFSFENESNLLRRDFLRLRTSVSEREQSFRSCDWSSVCAVPAVIPKGSQLIHLFTVNLFLLVLRPFRVDDSHCWRVPRDVDFFLCSKSRLKEIMAETSHLLYPNQDGSLEDRHYKCQMTKVLRQRRRQRLYTEQKPNSPTHACRQLRDWGNLFYIHIRMTANLQTPFPA